MRDTVGKMLVEAAKRFGDRPLVIAGDRTVSFRALDGISTQLADKISAAGIRHGDPVTLWLENGWRWMAWYYAILKCGGIVNPCNILLTPLEVIYIAKDCSAKAIVTAAAQEARLRDSTAGGLPLLLASSIADETGSAQVDRSSLTALNAPAAENISTIGYTSGTTGHPKGAVLRHSTIVINTAMTALMHGRTSADVVVSALPCAHVYGNIVMNAAVLCGMTLVLLSRFDERAALRAIREHRATIFDGVPAMYMKMLNVPELEGYDLSSLRLCTVGGQTMPVVKMEEVEHRFGCPLIELWGMTELGGLGTTHPHTRPRRHGSIGIALPSMEARVGAIDDACKEIPRGEVGELLVRGPLVMEGYLGDAEATRAAIEPNGWLHTGDLVRQDLDGYFFIVDRAKEVIVSGGYNVYPAEIERVIAQHSAVAMVAVAAIPDELKGQVAKAFVVCKDGERCTGAEIIEHCRPHLAPYKIPKAVEFMNDLPKTSSGKILRRALARSTI